MINWTKPVLREAWVVWDADGTVLVLSTETSARSHGGVYARAAVMSDGSPVEDEMIVPEEMGGGSWKATAEALQAEVADWKAKAIKAQADALEEHDRMHPVVDAAVIWERHFSPLAGERLVAAVRAHLNTEPATSDSHEAFVDDMMEVQRQPREPADKRSCVSCKWHEMVKYCPSCDEQFSRWEAKS